MSRTETTERTNHQDKNIRQSVDAEESEVHVCIQIFMIFHLLQTSNTWLSVKCGCISQNIQFSLHVFIMFSVDTYLYSTDYG